MNVYFDIILKTLGSGTYTRKPNGIDTISLFGYFFKHNLNDGFPLLTTRKISFKTVFSELMWMLSGDRTINELKKNTSIWNPWAKENGVLESSYGRFWRSFPSPIMSISDGEKWVNERTKYVQKADNILLIDQIRYVLDNLKSNPNSRKHIVIVWHPGNATLANVPPCPITFVFNVKGNFINLLVTLRSSDLSIGLPHDLAVYSLLLILVAKEVGLNPGEVAFSIVDAHIYCGQFTNNSSFYIKHLGYIQNLLKKESLKNSDLDFILHNKERFDDIFDHIPSLLKQLNRIPKELPNLFIKKFDSIFSINFDDINIINYKPDSPINFKIVI